MKTKPAYYSKYLKFGLLLVLLSGPQAQAMCADSLFRRQPKGFGPQVYVIDSTLYYHGRRVGAPYYVDNENNLFDANGFEVLSISNRIIFGGLEWQIGFDRRSTLLHYPKEFLTIRRGVGFANVGVGPDSFLYFDGHQCTNLGQGFYIHRGHLRCTEGKKVHSVNYEGPGRCTYVVTSWF